MPNGTCDVPISTSSTSSVWVADETLMTALNACSTAPSHANSLQESSLFSSNHKYATRSAYRSEEASHQTCFSSSHIQHTIQGVTDIEASRQHEYEISRKNVTGTRDSFFSGSYALQVFVYSPLLYNPSSNSLFEETQRL